MINFEPWTYFLKLLSVKWHSSAVTIYKQKQKNSDLVLYLKIIFSEIQQAIKIWSFTVSAYRP